MSTAHPPDALTPTRQDASQGAEILHTAPFGQTEGTVYTSLYPFPGLSHPPLAFPPNATFPAFSSSSFTSGLYGTGDVNYLPNHQGYGAVYPPADFMAPMQNPAPAMNDAYFQSPSYPSYDFPAGTATSTTDLLSSEDTVDQEQPAQITSQFPFFTQPEAAPVQDQQQAQYEVQDAQEDFSVEEHPKELGEDEREGEQTHEGSHADLVQPKNTTVHICSNNPTSACSGSGKICLDMLWVFVARYPNVLSEELVARCISAATAPGSNSGQSTTGSQVDTSDRPPSQIEAASWETASSGSIMTASTSTAVNSLPSESCFSPPSDYAAASESSFMGTVGSSTGKRQRSEDYPEDRPKKQRREHSADTNGPEHHHECKNQTVDGQEKRWKKKSVDGEFICVICMILGLPCVPLSRKDSLKRHFLKLHAMFEMLLKVEYKDFKILQPRNINEYEDLSPLIAFCITVQSQAREQGVEIKQEHDLALLYPDVAASMNLS